MKKIYVLRGLPASGKYKEAIEIMKKHNYNIFHISKIGIRNFMFSGESSLYNNFMVDLKEEKRVCDLLENGHSCVINDTNLTRYEMSKWSNIAIKYNADFELVDMTKTTTVSGCIGRNNRRDSKLDKNVIWKMALKNNLWNSWNGIVLCDIDGTLADISKRLKHIQKKGKYKDWESFYSEINTDVFRDEVWNDVKEVVEKNGFDLFLVTGRNEKYRDETIKWFKKHCPEILEKAKCIFMRGKNDFRPDTEVKKDFLRMFGKHEISLVYEDRPRLIKMYQDNKISVVDCGDGKDF